MADLTEAHVVLVGLPGAGKSTVGRILAEALGRPFLDFDAELVRRHGMSVAEIFGQRGEDHFRQLEHGLTLEVQARPGMVLSPGGGWVTRPDTVALLRPPARLVYLRIGPDAALSRMGAGASERPLLDRPDPRGELQRLLAERSSAYETADLVVDVERLDLKQVTQAIVQGLRG